MNALIAYLVAAALAWSPVQEHAKLDLAPEITQARYASIATDIATVCLDPKEEPLSKADHPRERTALLLLSLAFWESRLWQRVDQGHCLAWECDAYGQGKHAAVGVWQIHPEGGLTLDGLGFKYARERSSDWKLEHLGEIYGSPELLRDRKLQVRFALRIARTSIYNWTTAKSASSMASRWFRSHPYHSTP